MAGSCCGGAPAGAVRVYQFREPGKNIREFGSKADAEAAQKAANGAGHVVAITKRIR